MSDEYTADDLLPLSGIQHFSFCRRQWALIHVERQWQENVLTTEGKLLHDRADDPFFQEVRQGVIITRSAPVASYRLGLYGVCDVIEFSPASEGVHLPGRQGCYTPAPIEYKRGRQKQDMCDEVQLCAQALCLEEMLSVDIELVYLYYGETRHREPVQLAESLRQQVKDMALEMHAYFARGHTPRVKPSKACKSCSLADVCLPELEANVMPASVYIRKAIEGE
jgi:CRISPR-associated exonuclease Cas4